MRYCDDDTEDAELEYDMLIGKKSVSVHTRSLHRSVCYFPFAVLCYAVFVHSLSFLFCSHFFKKNNSFTFFFLAKGSEGSEGSQRDGEEITVRKNRKRHFDYEGKIAKFHC